MADLNARKSKSSISVIVPVFNIAQYIERCVKSIREQTHTSLEIILVDNGSTDGSSELVDAIAECDERIIAIHEDSQGVTHARLTGVRAATGEWIGFVDGDDYIEPDMYERLLDNALKYDTQISHCGYQMVFDDGRIHYFYNTGRLVQQDKLTGLKDLLSGSFIEPGLCNKLFHKTLFHSLLHDDVMDPNIKNNEDLLMNFILFSNADRSVYEDFCPYHYIVRQGSASRDNLNSNRIFDPIRVKKLIVDLSPQEIKNSAQAAYLSTCINTFSSMTHYSKKMFSEERHAVRRLILDKKQDIRLLNSKQRVLAYLIRFTPNVYPFLYRIYSNHFQEKKYV